MLLFSSVARVRRLFLLVLAVLACAAVAGCGSSGELVSAGTAAPVAPPKRLWPHRSPAPMPTEQTSSLEDPLKIPNVRGASTGNIRALVPYDILAGTVAAMAEKGPIDSLAPYLDKTACTAGKSGCPVMEPVYQDLTGDGKDDLILGFSLHDPDLVLRCYAFVDGQLTRILDIGSAPLSVDLADGKLIVTEPAGDPGYVVRREYVWDAHLGSMTQRTDEVRRVDKGATPSPGGHR